MPLFSQASVSTTAPNSPLTVPLLDMLAQPPPCRRLVRRYITPIADGGVITVKMSKGTITPDAPLKNASPAKPLIPMASFTGHTSSQSLPQIPNSYTWELPSTAVF
ncbi:hypothetical protein EYF80_014682 [Liparis tanakae]|uniref:Uncharacterized protein n=1 Tax=Liparis tanakae TaxID=230148 RepID=A0A4Z2IAL5_9TELE|nr:hypothetical protein EYF80_014682 [Liparis tanakae]